MDIIKKEEFLDKNNRTMCWYKLTLRYVSFCEHLLKSYENDERYYQYKFELIIKALFLFRIRTDLINKNQDNSLCSNIMEEQSEYYRLGILQENKEEILDACCDIAVFLINSIKLNKDEFRLDTCKITWNYLKTLAYQFTEEYEDKCFRNMGNEYKDTLSWLISRYVGNDVKPMLLKFSSKMRFIIDILYHSYKTLNMDNNKLMIDNLLETVKVVIHRYGKWNDGIGKFVKYKSMDIEDESSVLDYIKEHQIEMNGYSYNNSSYEIIKEEIEENRYMYIYKTLAIPKLYKPKYKC